MGFGRRGSEVPRLIRAPPGLRADTWSAWLSVRSEGSGEDSAPSGPVAPPHGPAAAGGGAICLSAVRHRLGPLHLDPDAGPPWKPGLDPGPTGS